MAAFAPGPTITMTVGTASTSIPIDPQATVLRLMNAGNNAAFVRWGTGPQTATLNDYPLMPTAGLANFVAKPIGADTLAGITTGASNVIYVTTGYGGL